jgi:hypothetical protein
VLGGCQNGTTCNTDYCYCTTDQNTAVPDGGPPSCDTTFTCGSCPNGLTCYCLNGSPCSIGCLLPGICQ